jgi:hypothetical protein
MTSTVFPKPALAAGPIFNDKSFFFETLRVLGYALYGGADIGEVIGTASRVSDGDEAPGTPSGGRSPSGSTPTPIAAPPKVIPSARSPISADCLRRLSLPSGGGSRGPTGPPDAPWPRALRERDLVPYLAPAAPEETAHLGKPMYRTSRLSAEGSDGKRPRRF